MKFFWYSVKGYSLGIAQRVRLEGNQVRWFLKEKNDKTKGVVGKGMIDIAKADRPERDEIVVFDFTGAGKRADELRRDGYNVIGGSVFSDALEHNRFYATQLLKVAGVQVPPTFGFTDLQAGIAFVKGHSVPLVFKPEGEWPAWMTMVADDNEALAKDLERVAKLHGNKIKFDLQERVRGMEVSIEGWFNGQDWVHHSINSTFEEKRLLTGSLGPNTGCMGNAVFFYKHARPRLAKETLLKLTALLRKVDYRGPLDINTKGGFALEFTPRFGYDAIQTAIELLEMDLGKVLADTAKGTLKQFKTSFEYSMGVTMSVPPFPSDSKEEVAKSYGEVVRLPKELIPYFYYGDVQLDDDGEVITSGSDGVVGVMTAVGPNVGAAKRLCYERVAEVSVPNVQYRLDIGDRAIKEIPQLLREVASGANSTDSNDNL